MAFDMGFNFRATAGYVTDPAYGVPVLAEAYPHTYTNTNGYSINAGWTVAPTGNENRDATADPRIAGINYKSADGNLSEFKVDLSSGSAPGAGTYTVDVAIGDLAAAHNNDFKVRDTTTVLIDGTNGTTGINTAAAHFLDATVTDVGPLLITWVGTTVQKTFATTVAAVGIGFNNVGGDNNTCLCHFRLTLAAAGWGLLLSGYRNQALA